jgi:hypothetical protein
MLQGRQVALICLKLLRYNIACTIQDVTDACSNEKVPADQDGWDLREGNLLDGEKLFLMQCSKTLRLSAAFVCCRSLEVGGL